MNTRAGVPVTMSANSAAVCRRTSARWLAELRSGAETVEPVGSDGGGRWARAFVQTPGAAAVRASLCARAGVSFDGTAVPVSVSPSWRASAHLDLGATLEHSRIRFDARGQRFDASIPRLRSMLSLDTQLSADAFVQYNSHAGAAGAPVVFRDAGRAYFVRPDEIDRVEAEGVYIRIASAVAGTP